MATTTTPTTGTQTTPVGATTNVYNRTETKPNRTAFWVIGLLIVAAVIVWFASRDRTVDAVNYSNPASAPVTDTNNTN